MRDANDFFSRFDIITKVPEDKLTFKNDYKGQKILSDDFYCVKEFREYSYKIGNGKEKRTFREYKNFFYCTRVGIAKKGKKYYLYVLQKNETIDLFKIKATEFITNSTENLEDLENLEDFSDILNAGTENEKYVVKYLVINNNAINRKNLRIFKVGQNDVIPLNIDLKNIITDEFQRIEFISDNGKTFFIKEKNKYTFRKLKKDKTAYFDNYERIENFFICEYRGKLEIYNFNGEQQYSDYEILPQKLYDKNIRFLDLKKKEEKKSILIKPNRIIEIEKIKLLKFKNEIKYIVLSELENKQEIKNNRLIKKSIKKPKVIYTSEGTQILKGREILTEKRFKENENQNIDSFLCKIVKERKKSKRYYDNDENKKILVPMYAEIFYLDEMGEFFVRDIENINFNNLKYKNIYCTNGIEGIYIIFYEIYIENLNIINFCKVRISKNLDPIIINCLNENDKDIILKELEKNNIYKDDSLIIEFESYGEKNEIKKVYE